MQLGLDDTSRVDRICARCKSIGADRICVAHSKDPTRRSCLGHACNGDINQILARWQIEYSVAECIKTAEAGCELCTIFYNAWQEHNKTKLKGTFNVNVVYHCPCRGKTDSLVLRAIDTNDSRPFANSLAIQLLLQDRYDNDPRPRSKSTGSPETITRLRDLLQSCTTDDDHCNSYRTAQSKRRRLPTRLLDLDKCFTEGVVRVVESKDLIISTSYTTLSHRWGSDSGYKLTKASYRSFKGDILLRDLPLTFKEACIVTKELGCRYIWIDFLCIDQESELDWLQEASRMADIYAMSLLTIAASASDNAREGLFRDRQYHHERHACLQFSCSCDATWLSSSSEAGFSWRQDDLPLHNRGWVFQEMALSCCVAYFTGSGVNWGCLTVDADEIRQSPAKYRAYAQGHESSAVHTLRCGAVDNARPLTKSLLAPECQLSDADWWTWEALVSNYSHTELTFPDDKLIALAGIARNFKLNDPQDLGKYCAGIWETELVWGLLWSRHHEASGDQPSPRPKCRYPAPTWSWASMEGPLEWTLMDNDARCWLSIVSVDMSLALSSDPFGAVKGGRLRVKAPLVRCPSNLDLVKCSPRRGTARWAGRHFITSRLTFMQLVGLTNFKRWFLAALVNAVEQVYYQHAKPKTWAIFKDRLKKGWDFYRFSNLVLDEPCRIRPDRTFFMPIWDMRRKRTSLRGHDLQTSRGLILQRTGASESSYRRVGYLETEDSGWDWRDAVDDALFPDGTHLGRQEDGRYLIDLV